MSEDEQRTPIRGLVAAFNGHGQTSTRWSRMVDAQAVAAMDFGPDEFHLEAPLDIAHQAHLDSVIEEFTADLRAKYVAGQRDHGGNLWEKPGMLGHAIEEVLDLAVYLYTLRQQLQRKGINL